MLIQCKNQALISIIKKPSDRETRTTCSKPSTRFAHSISLVISRLDLARRGAI